MSQSQEAPIWFNALIAQVVRGYEKA